MYFRIKAGERGYLQVVQQTSRCRGGSFSALKTAISFLRAIRKAPRVARLAKQESCHLSVGSATQTEVPCAAARHENGPRRGERRGRCWSSMRMPNADRGPKGEASGAALLTRQ